MGLLRISALGTAAALALMFGWTVVALAAL